MTFDKPRDANDARLTAYALGELDEVQRAEVEALLASDTKARREVEELTGLAGELTAALRPAQDAVTGDDLDPERRGVVLTGARWDATRTKTRARLWRRLGATAAMLVVGFPALMILLLVFGVFTPGGGGQGFRIASDGEERWKRVSLEVTDEQLGSAPSLEGLPRVGPDSVIVGRLENEALHIAAHGKIEEDVVATEPCGSQAEPRPGTPVPAPRVTAGVTAGGTPTGIGGGAGQSCGASGTGGAGGGHVDLTSAGNVPILGSLPTTGKAFAPGARDPSDPAAPGAGARGARWYGWELDATRTKAYTGIDPFRRVSHKGGHTSTFGVDVDTASYSQVRRLLLGGTLPHAQLVRIEELVNYFDYGYAPPARGAAQPFRTHVQVAACPWNPKHRLARIAIKGREVDGGSRPAVNLVFLVDVSGSMDEEDKLPLVKLGLETLAEQMRPDDRVAIVTYASSARVVLASTPGSEKAAILAAIRALTAGGSTNGAGGIQLAYEEAAKGFRKAGVNRVLLCTDGDFNVGVSDTGGLVRLIEQKVQTGVYLSVLGYGTGNFKDGKMEQLSNHGNGNYAYIDSRRESERVLVDQIDGTLVTIAKDVKFQLWFNPKTVAGWRLLGYENRRLAARDFNDDKKDAGDVGAGHEVTALYEIVPTGAAMPGSVDPNPFLPGTGGGAGAAPARPGPAPADKALFIWRLRWKAPEGGASTLVEHNVFDTGLGFEQVDRDFQWAAATAACGMLLRHSPHGGQASWDLVAELATPAKGEDPKGVRAEFLEIVAAARKLQQR